MKSKINTLNIKQLQVVSESLKAMAHPMRIAILGLLENGKLLTVKEIHELLNIGQATTSHHLGILKNKGVLTSERIGKNTFYFFKHERFSEFIEFVSNCKN